MNDQIRELSRRAVTGDVGALRELFALAEHFEAERQFSESTVAFHEVAIAYRIAASRNLARAEDAERQAAYATRVLDIYRQWIENNPTGPRKLPYDVPEATKGYSGAINTLLSDSSLGAVFVFLERSLSAVGMEFFSPGGSFERRLYVLLGAMFGADSDVPSYFSNYIRDTAVRVALDTLADEVVRLCRGGHVGPPRDASLPPRP